MPCVRLPAVRLYYEEVGSGVPIGLIHGTSSDADIWGPAKAELARLGMSRFSENSQDIAA